MPSFHKESPVAMDQTVTSVPRPRTFSESQLFSRCDEEILNRSETLTPLNIYSSSPKISQLSLLHWQAGWSAGCRKYLVVFTSINNTLKGSGYFLDIMWWCWAEMGWIPVCLVMFEQTGLAGSGFGSSCVPPIADVWLNEVHEPTEGFTPTSAECTCSDWLWLDLHLPAL